LIYYQADINEYKGRKEVKNGKLIYIYRSSYWILYSMLCNCMDKEKIKISFSGTLNGAQSEDPDC
jgi:hypothetical protein